MRIATLALAFALPTGAAGEPVPAPAGEAVFAEQITAANFARAVRGPDADAGVGDWMFSNGTLCASVSAPEHETYLSATGGSLIDLGFCGRDDDQWAAYHDLANLSREAVFAARSVAAAATTEAASISVTGDWGGLQRITRYTLDRAAPDELQIETTVTRTAESDALSLLGSIILHTNRSLTPFVVSTASPQWSKGFGHPFVDTSDRSGMAKLLFPADLSIMIGPASGAPEISYGVLSAAPELVAVDGARTALRQYSIDDQDFSLIGGFSNALWFDTDAQPGLLQLAQIPIMDLDVGESLRIRRRIMVSQQADAAGITNRVYSGAMLRGRTDTADNRILVTDLADKPLSFARPSASGDFEVRLPAGLTRARLVLNTPFREAARTLDADAGAAGTVLLAGESHTGTLELPALGLPMRLVFRGRNGTQDPLLLSDLRGFRVGDQPMPADAASNGVSLAGVAGDRTELTLPAGDYTVYATRGPEYSLERAELRLEPGARAALAIRAPRRVLKSRQWISADFHVHSEYSFDSTLPARDRIADFVAQGAEVMVATEHKRVVDYQPVVEAMGLRHAVVTVAGTELTGMATGGRMARTIGHDNVFPLTAEPLAYQGGVLAHENRRLGEVIAAHKALDPQIVFQLNHPRLAGNSTDDIYFFNHLSVDRPYDPSQPLESESNRSLIEVLPGSSFRDIDFDAIEVMNGTRIGSYREIRTDWFSFLLQGYRHTATGNSDSHSAGEIVAMPRNYVRTNRMRVDEEAVERFDRGEFLSSIHRGRLFATTGPLLDVRLGGKGLGATVSGRHADLSVRVHAADWVPVERLRVYVNGVLVRESPASRHGTHEMTLDFAKDSFVTVEVEGSASGGYAAVYPGFTPFAFTNPIFVDANGDGEWSAPGLVPK